MQITYSKQRNQTLHFIKVHKIERHLPLTSYIPYLLKSKEVEWICMMSGYVDSSFMSFYSSILCVCIQDRIFTERLMSLLYLLNLNRNTCNCKTVFNNSHIGTLDVYVHQRHAEKAINYSFFERLLRRETILRRWTYTGRCFILGDVSDWTLVVSCP